MALLCAGVTLNPLPDNAAQPVGAQTLAQAHGPVAIHPEAPLAASAWGDVEYAAPEPMLSVSYTSIVTEQGELAYEALPLTSAFTQGILQPPRA